MKFTKKHIAKLLHTTPNVMATSGELVQFFRSKQYNPDEEHEGNFIEDFLSFRGDLDKDLLESKVYCERLINVFTSSLPPSKIPAKVLKQLINKDHE